MFTAHITIMPLKELLDPQGKAVLGGLKNLNIDKVNDVRVGKHISLKIESTDAGEAKEMATTAAKKLLANPVMEMFEVVVEEDK